MKIREREDYFMIVFSSDLSSLIKKAMIHIFFLLKYFDNHLRIIIVLILDNMTLEESSYEKSDDFLANIEFEFSVRMNVKIDIARDFRYRIDRDILLSNKLI